jgi:hypothetical protein
MAGLPAGSTATVDQGDDRATVPLLHREHVLEQVVAGVDEVVGEQDGERLVADERGGLQHRVPQAARLPLADEVDAGHLGGAHRRQPLGVAPLLQRLLELGPAVEVVLDGRLAAAGDHEHVAETGAGGLLDDVLHRRAVDHRQQFLGHGLGRRQQAGAHPVDRHDRLADGSRRTGAGTGHAASLAILVR